MLKMGFLSRVNQNFFSFHKCKAQVIILKKIPSRRQNHLILLFIKVFRFQRKTLLFLLGFFFLIIFFFLPFLFRGFLENASIDFHEIFTDDTL